MDLIVDGHRAFAATGGKPFDRGRPACILVHGAGLDHTVWSHQARWYAHHGRAVAAVDLPGHGRSAGNPLPTIRAMGDWLVHLLDALDVEQAALAGHSMGAMAVLEAAARHPDRVRSLALLGVAARMPVHPDLIELAAAGDPAAIELMVEWSHGPRTWLGGRNTPGISVMGICRQIWRRAAPGVIRADLEACDGHGDLLQSAARVTCPSLVLLGEQDRMAPPREAKELTDALVRGYSIVLPAAGHMMMTERPDATTDALRHAL